MKNVKEELRNLRGKEGEKRGKEEVGRRVTRLHSKMPSQEKKKLSKKQWKPEGNRMIYSKS